MDNKQTLGDLKAKSDQIEVTSKYSSKYELEYHFQGEKLTYSAKDETKLKDFKDVLRTKIGDDLIKPKKFFKMTFKFDQDNEINA